MRRINLQAAKVLLGLLFCCLIPLVVLAQEESKAKDPAEENSAPEIHSQTRVKLGGISLGGFYRHYSGFDYYPYYYPYSSALWGMMPYSLWPYPDFSPAFYHPGYYDGFSRSDGMGEVRAYTLEVQGHGNERFKKRIYVLSGKTVKVNAALIPEREEVRQ
jgi:hypothetical protein